MCIICVHFLLPDDQQYVPIVSDPFFDLVDVPLSNSSGVANDSWSPFDCDGEVAAYDGEKVTQVSQISISGVFNLRRLLNSLRGNRI